MTRRCGTSSGQGLLEVVIVLALFLGAVAAAVPAYLGMQARKAEKSAKAHLVAAVPMVMAYRQDHGSYAGMDAVDLLAIDPRLSPGVSVATAKRRSYCLTDTVHGTTWSLRGPFHGDPKFSSNASCD